MQTSLCEDNKDDFIHQSANGIRHRHELFILIFFTCFSDCEFHKEQQYSPYALDLGLLKGDCLTTTKAVRYTKQWK